MNSTTRLLVADGLVKAAGTFDLGASSGFGYGHGPGFMPPTMQRQPAFRPRARQAAPKAAPVSAFKSYFPEPKAAPQPAPAPQAAPAPIQLQSAAPPAPLNMPRMPAIDSQSRTNLVTNAKSGPMGGAGSGGAWKGLPPVDSGSRTNLVANAGSPAGFVPGGGQFGGHGAGGSWGELQSAQGRNDLVNQAIALLRRQ